MRITNRLNLPQALVDACDVKPHNEPNTVSATTLKSGVREILLTQRHWEEMEDDVSNRIWALFGTAVHALLEKEAPDTFVEEKFEQQIGKYKVTGRLDCYDMKQKIIFDYKTASTWKYKFADYSDWDFQGLVYAWLLKQAGLEVKECRFVMFFKDFSWTKASVEQGYPKSPTEVHAFEVTDKKLAEIEEKIKAKIKELEESEKLSDEELPLCSPSERWAKEGKLAVMKEGRKTAVKLFDENQQKDAELFIKSMNDNKLYIEHREGSDGKCENYCGCCKFCSYYQEKYGQKN